MSSFAQQNEISRLETLMKYDQQFGNYSKALEYNKKLLDICLKDSMYAANKMKGLITTHCDLCYSLGIPHQMYNYLEDYIKKVDNHNKYLYPGVFYTMLAEYRGNIRDYRYIEAVHHLNLYIDGNNVLKFFECNKPSADGLNIFNKVYLLLAEADVFLLKKDYERCQSILDDIEVTYKEHFKRDPKLSIYPKMMMELSLAYSGHTEEAITHAKKNILFMENHGLKNSSEYASELNHLQLYCHKIGRHQESITYGKRLRNPDFDSKTPLIPIMYQATNSFANSFKPVHYIQTKELLADSYLAVGNEIEAEKLMSEVFDFSLKGIYKAALEKEGYKDADMFLSPLIQYAPLYANRLKTQNLAGYLYNSALTFKQFSLYADKLIRNLVNGSSNAQLKKIYKRLQETKGKLDVAQSSEVDSLANRIAHLEAQLFNGVKRDNNMLNDVSTSWEQVKNALNPDEVAVEFISANISEDETHYIACVVSSDMASPQIVELCSEIDLLTIENTYTEAEAYQIIWKPLESFFNEKKSIYFSPMGYLNNIALEYLLQESGKAMNEDFEMFRLSSTREILANTEKSQTYKSNILFGGVKYDLNENERSEQIEHSRAFRNHSLIDNDVDEDYSPLLRAGLNYLPGTKVEVETIGEIISENNATSKIFSGLESTEEVFKSLPVQEPQLLHIATHGFYIPAETKSKLTKLYGYLNKRSSTEDISLSRSGLMLTGAVNTINEMNVSKADCEDGILTAREISRLDFTSLDLVVLSACKTGLGDINSDGVYGLQRGFKKAGAKTIVMSLWKVDDDATKIWMTEFYKNIYAGQSKYQSFTSAQRTLRTIENGKYNEPVYWAAFVMLDAK